MRPKAAAVNVGEDGYDLTPMIDIVFLLLVYFLWTTDLVQEADISLTLPADVKPEKDDVPPNEHIIDIEPSGEILLNGVPMDDLDSRSMPNLIVTLKRLKETADKVEMETAVTILADESSLHQRSIDVLNACAAAEIKLVSFSDG